MIKIPPPDTVDDSNLQQLVYGLSHNMGAPLRGVIQFSQLLQNNLKEQLPEKEGHWLELIRQNGEQAQQMIDSLLFYSRLTSQSEQTTFSLDAVINAQLKQIEKNLNINLQQVDINLSGNLPDICGYRYYWELLIYHLIHNALLYHPLDSSHNRKLLISTYHSDEILHCCIEDNGLGVSENNWPQLTIPFKRMQSDQEYSGQGMGLTYCNRITQLQGGTLTFAHSSLGGLAVNYKIPVYTE